ncbi:hypothetical protein [Cryptosporangium phraense]|uniref:Uncharacterized protein n=1 Tax=Cryptosporangium phraense TaxID=2593070 RepID=A0A545ALP7_9ACTN|nr:hypothetical protein [Cryptosporangium phraense]TQS42243.1 hypothetical protein FL583_25235 [Cryptosporangium phraense]
MIVDPRLFGPRRSVPAEERASVESGWDAHYGSDFALGELAYEGYEFEDHDGRVMLYIQYWCS